MIRAVILTTPTVHHTYYVQQLAARHEVAAVVYEHRHVTPKVPVGPLFEEFEDEFEARYFFDSAEVSLPESIPVHDVGRVNDPGVDELLRGYDADIGLVFGCGKIQPHVFDVARLGLINVHRGISERYRGLDSDLWAIFNDDPEHIGVTIHRIDAELDTGDILRVARLRNASRILTHQIRYYTSVLATELTHEVLDELDATGSLSGRAQTRGRYYSFMPLEKKREVQRRFDAGVESAGWATDYQANLFCFDRRSRSELCILLYHGVTDTPSEGIENYSGKHMAVDEFRRQMTLVSERCHLLSMDEVSEHCAAGHPFPERSVAVTFDDAFENVATIAFPVMEELGVPFTFYVSTGFVDTEMMFWVDIVEDCLNRTGRSMVRLPLLDAAFHLGSQERRVDACERIKAWCKVADVADKDTVVEALIEETGVRPSVEVSPNYRKAGWSELRQLAASPLATFGGHTHSHNIMSRMDDDTLCDEIETSLGLLRRHLDRPIHHYSYPEGQPTHYDARVISALQARGVVCSPSAVTGLNLVGASPFHLRRVMVGFGGMPFPFSDTTLNPELVP